MPIPESVCRQRYRSATSPIRRYAKKIIVTPLHRPKSHSVVSRVYDPGPRRTNLHCFLYDSPLLSLSSERKCEIVGRFLPVLISVKIFSVDPSGKLITGIVRCSGFRRQLLRLAASPCHRRDDVGGRRRDVVCRRHSDADAAAALRRHREEPAPRAGGRVRRARRRLPAPRPHPSRAPRRRRRHRPRPAGRRRKDLLHTLALSGQAAQERRRVPAPRRCRWWRRRRWRAHAGQMTCDTVDRSCR